MPPVQAPVRISPPAPVDEAKTDTVLSTTALTDAALTDAALTDAALTTTTLTTTALGDPALDQAQARPRPATRAARPRKAPARYPTADDDWQERGACRSANPSLFFAPDNETNHQRRFRETAAKAICAHCPVRAVCRAYALQTGEVYGIWGGTTERERMRSAAQHRRAAAAPIRK